MVENPKNNHIKCLFLLISATTTDLITWKNILWLSFFTFWSGLVWAIDYLKKKDSGTLINDLH